MKKAVLWVRVSSDEQQKGYSPEAQLKLLKEYSIKQRFSIDKVFNETESAKQSEFRNSFKAMLDYVNTKDIPVIVVEKTDRLYRNFKDYVYLDELIEQKNLEIHLVKENEVMSRSSSSHQKFIHSIKVVLAKHFIDNLKEETKKGLDEKAKQGVYPGWAPLGYINDTDKKTIELDERRARYIKLAYELYATGDYTLESLQEELHKKGLRTKKGIEVTKHGVQTVLKNSFYYGDFVWGGVKYKGSHESIIDKQLFDRVEAVFADKNVSRIRTKRIFAYKRILKCGYCGRAVTAERQKDVYVYYRCSNPKDCSLKYFKEEELEKIFMDAIRLLKIDGRIKDWVIQALKESHQDEETYISETLKKLRQEYTTIERKKHEVYHDKLNHVITSEFFTKEYNLLQDRQSQVRSEIRVLENNNDEYIEQGMMILNLTENLYEKFQHMETIEKAKLLGVLFSKCKLKNDGIDLNWKPPFGYIYDLYNYRLRGE